MRPAAPTTPSSGSACTSPTRPSSTRSGANSTSTNWPSRTPSPRTSGPGWRSTTTPCSWSRPPQAGQRPRRRPQGDRVPSGRRAAHRAAGPMAHSLVPGLHGELGEYFRDIQDHLVRVVETVNGFRDLLTSVLEANLTQVGVRQNQDMRRISAWVAIVAVPTMIAGIYGMNFKHMPELGWPDGYPLALLLMASICSVLYWRFRKAGWL